MSRLVEREVTIIIDGDEHDAPVRCWVDVRAIGASLDGRPEVFVDGEWTEMECADIERVEDAICEQAINEEADAHDDRDPGDFR